MSCVDNIPIENLESCATEEVVAGVSETGVYAAPVKDFESIESPADFEAAVAEGDLATIAAAHVFKADKGFHKVQFIPFTGKVETAQVGEAGNLSFQNSLTGTLKGTSAKVAAWTRRYKNEPMIYIVKEKNGDVKQIGSELSPAYMSEFTGSSGAKAGDLKSSILKIMDTQAYPAPQYDGTIQEFPAPAPV